MVTDTEWKAIIENNPSYDDNFAMLSKPQKYFVDLPVPHVHQNEKILRYITILQNLKKMVLGLAKGVSPTESP